MVDLILTFSVKGDTSNAEGKVAPRRIRSWANYASGGKEIWDDLMSTRLKEKKRLWKEAYIIDQGAIVSTLLIGSEKDLDRRVGECLEQPVAAVIREIARNQILSTRFLVLGPVDFASHRNTMLT